MPIPDEASRPFFDGARRGRAAAAPLRGLRHVHGADRRIGTPLRPRCVRCFSAELEWAPAAGGGTLYSFALMHQVYDPAFAAEIPTTSPSSNSTRACA